MTRLQTFGGTPAACITPIPSTRSKRTATAKKKRVRPDAKAKVSAARTTPAGTIHAAPKSKRGDTAKLIRQTDAAFFAALSPGKDGSAVRDAFAGYATVGNLDGHWRLHWNGYLAFLASVPASPSRQVSEPASEPLQALRNHVTGAIERGEAEAVVEKPVAHISREIAEAFGMDKLPESLVQIHDDRPLPPGLQPYFAGVKVGETVRFVPNDPRNRTVEGIVQDLVNICPLMPSACRALNIFCPLPGDPTRVLRVWAEDGCIEPPAEATIEDDSHGDDSEDPTSVLHDETPAAQKSQTECLRALGI